MRDLPLSAARHGDKGGEDSRDVVSFVHPHTSRSTSAFQSRSPHGRRPAVVRARDKVLRLFLVDLNAVFLVLYRRKMRKSICSHHMSWLVAVPTGLIMLSALSSGALGSITVASPVAPKDVSFAISE